MLMRWKFEDRQVVQPFIDATLTIEHTKSEENKFLVEDSCCLNIWNPTLPSAYRRALKNER